MRPDKQSSNRRKPLQNRVTPFGEIVAVPDRGQFLGNRGGRIHEDKTIRRRWASKAWIYCILEFKGRHRSVMGTGYTELFFRDEATALAAGHRPCFECQRARAIEFAQLWSGGPKRARAGDMDMALHKERLGSAPQVTKAEADIPGAMVAIDGAPYLVTDAGLHQWSFGEYGSTIAWPSGHVTLLTPRSTLAVLRAGFAVSGLPNI